MARNGAAYDLPRVFAEGSLIEEFEMEVEPEAERMDSTGGASSEGSDEGVGASPSTICEAADAADGVGLDGGV